MPRAAATSVGHGPGAGTAQMRAAAGVSRSSRYAPTAIAARAIGIRIKVSTGRSPSPQGVRSRPRLCVRAPAGAALGLRVHGRGSVMSQTASTANTSSREASDPSSLGRRRVSTRTSRDAAGNASPSTGQCSALVSRADRHGIPPALKPHAPAAQQPGQASARPPTAQATEAHEARSEHPNPLGSRGRRRSARRRRNPPATLRPWAQLAVRGGHVALSG
jgi:hypothetical protein